RRLAHRDGPNAVAQHETKPGSDPLRERWLAQPVEGVAPLTTQVDDALIAQLREVLGDAGVRNPKHFHQGVHVPLPLAQLFDDAQSSGMGQHREQPGELRCGDLSVHVQRFEYDDVGVLRYLRMVYPAQDKTTPEIAFLIPSFSNAETVAPPLPGPQSGASSSAGARRRPPFQPPRRAPPALFTGGLKPRRLF